MNQEKAQCVAVGSAALAVVAGPYLLNWAGGTAVLATCQAWMAHPTVPWSRPVSGMLLGLASLAMSVALLRWRSRGHGLATGLPCVVLAMVLLVAGLAQWIEVLAQWLPDPRMAGGAQYLTTVTTGLTAVALFHALPKLWDPATQSTPAAPGGNGLAWLPQQPHATDRHVQRDAPTPDHPTAPAAEPDALAAALAEAEHNSQLKDRFLAMVCHELRTPLQSTRYWAEMLRRQAEGSGMLADAANHIIHNVNVQARMVEDLLNLSRMLNGQLQVSLQPCDAAEAVRHAVHASQAEASARGIAIEYDAPAGAVSTVADPCRLEQVACNLISNAVHASPEGACIHVRLSATDKALQLTVQDRGVGIAPEDLPHLFNAFRQGRACAAHHGGLGLGLAIAQSIVQQLGGQISAHSDGPGHGACFTVDLPRHLDPGRSTPPRT